MGYVKCNFFLKKSRQKNGEAPLIIRFSYLGKRIDHSTSKWVNVENWSQLGQLILSKKKRDLEINSFIESLKAKTNMIECKWLKINKQYTLEEFYKSSS